MSVAQVSPTVASYTVRKLGFKPTINPVVFQSKIDLRELLVFESCSVSSHINKKNNVKGTIKFLLIWWFFMVHTSSSIG